MRCRKCRSNNGVICPVCKSYVTEMRSYIWYSPELDIFVLQQIMTDCYITFEWESHDMYKTCKEYGLYEQNEDPLTLFSWVPMGEL